MSCDGKQTKKLIDDVNWHSSHSMDTHCKLKLWLTEPNEFVLIIIEMPYFN